MSDTRIVYVPQCKWDDPRNTEPWFDLLALARGNKAEARALLENTLAYHNLSQSKHSSRVGLTRIVKRTIVEEVVG